MIRAVLFDMDGTLIDSERIYRPAWIKALEDFGASIDTEYFFKRVAGMNITTMQAFCEAEYGKDFPFVEIRQRRREYVLEQIEREGIPCKPGVPAILSELMRRGIRIAVASSSGGEWVRFCLARAGIDASLFECIMSGECVEKSKPDPEIFLKTAAAMGFSPEECVVAEDSANGVLAGYAAGMKTVMIPDLQPCTEALRPCLWHCIDTLEALPVLIENFNRESENKA